jgi:hypothetical protein
MFKEPNLPAERRLRHVEAQCGTPEMKLVGHGYETLNLSEVIHDSKIISIVPINGYFFDLIVVDMPATKSLLFLRR